VLKKYRDFFFSEANSTWRNNRGHFSALRSTLAIFESETLKKAEAISKNLIMAAHGKISQFQKSWRFESYDQILMSVCAKRLKEWAQLLYQIKLKNNNCI
jgi:hypothetical protein